MKRPGNSSAAMISICPNTSDEDDKDQINNEPIYARSDFEDMLDGSSHGVPAEKKKRLSASQVKALENNFEVENKLEPERKVKLAQELGLQPRQVAVWFQNRRARSKTKRLERDYGALEANYDGLKLKYENLQHENKALLEEISELKAKLSADCGDAKAKPHQENVSLNRKCEETVEKIDEKLNDGSGDDDSDSSAVLNEGTINCSNSLNAAVSSSPCQLLDVQLQTSSSSLSKASGVTISNGGRENDNYDHQLVKTEEQDFFNGDEESCVDLFSDDQAPSLPWICSDDWS